VGKKEAFPFRGESQEAGESLTRLQAGPEEAGLKIGLKECPRGQGEGYCQGRKLRNNRRVHLDSVWETEQEKKKKAHGLKGGALT